MNCVLCGDPVKTRHRLYDRNGKNCGDYCSPSCAKADAWGPRFFSFRVRKLPALKRTA